MSGSGIPNMSPVPIQINEEEDEEDENEGGSNNEISKQLISLKSSEIPSMSD